MADFCTECCRKLFPETIKPEIDVYEIFKELRLGYYRCAFLCEGCTLTAILKTESGELKVAYLNENETKQSDPYRWAEYPKLKRSK